MNGRRDIGEFEYGFHRPISKPFLTWERVATGTPVSVYAHSYDDDYGDPLEYLWTLPDGGTSTEETFERTFAAPGRYTFKPGWVRGLQVDGGPTRSTSAWTERCGATVGGGFDGGACPEASTGWRSPCHTGAVKRSGSTAGCGAAFARGSTGLSREAAGSASRRGRGSGPSASGRLSFPGVKQQLKPLFDQVVIKELEPDRVRRSGLLLPPGEHETPPQHGIVLAVGPGLDWWGGVGIKMPVAPGDHVVFPGSAGVWVDIEEERLLVCRVGQLLGVLDEVDEPGEPRLGSGGAVSGSAE